MSVLSKEHEKDSFRLSWGAEHLDNVVLSSSLLHSGYTHTLTDTHALPHPLLYSTVVLLTAKSSLDEFTLFSFHFYLFNSFFIFLSLPWCFFSLWSSFTIVSLLLLYIYASFSLG